MYPLIVFLFWVGPMIELMRVSRVLSESLICSLYVDLGLFTFGREFLYSWTTNFLIKSRCRKHHVVPCLSSVTEVVEELHDRSSSPNSEHQSLSSWMRSAASGPARELSHRRSQKQVACHRQCIVAIVKPFAFARLLKRFSQFKARLLQPGIVEPWLRLQGWT